MSPIGRPTKAAQKLRHLCRSDRLPRRLFIDRRKPDGNILVEFDLDSASTDHNQRAEIRIDPCADEDLTERGDLPLNQEAEEFAFHLGGGHQHRFSGTLAHPQPR